MVVAEELTAMTALNEVIVYHDETDIGRYKGHVLLFIPNGRHETWDLPLLGRCIEDFSPIDILLKEMIDTRQWFDLSTKKLHFADISGRKWTRWDVGVRSIVALAVDALRRRRVAIVPRPLHCKLAVMFYASGADLSIYGGKGRGEKRLRHDETILRFLLKGALHYLYSHSEKVTVEGLVSDGEPYHRPLDEGRVIWRITVDQFSGRTPLRSYASFAPGAEITGLSSDHKQYRLGTSEYRDANMLQLADLLLGSVIRSCHIGCTDCPRVPRPDTSVDAKKDVIAYPVKKMLEKQKRGKGFESSGHFGSFSISSISFSQQGPRFQRLNPKEVRITPMNLELPFTR